MIAQAIVEGLSFVSKDSVLAGYSVQYVWERHKNAPASSLRDEHWSIRIYDRLVQGGVENLRDRADFWGGNGIDRGCFGFAFCSAFATACHFVLDAIATVFG